MKFYDEVTVRIRSGRGGDGNAAGRREKYVAYGGPAGGDGGEGGSIYLEANHNEYTLMAYRVNATYKAENGEHGKGKDLYGHAGEDKTLFVPVGTVVHDEHTGEYLGSVRRHGERLLLLKGGKGGLGNKHFVTPQKQWSTIALLGEPSYQKSIILELQLLADVGLVGAPSVGKSSFINSVSNVKAEVAEYHFTTLVPNLGVLTHGGKSFTMIDIPGLIEGASLGKGLGNQFLRHLLKSSLLTLTIDSARFESGIDEALGLLNERDDYLIQQFGEGTSTRLYENKELIHRFESEEKTITKKWYFLFSKSDLVYDKEIRNELSELLYTKFMASRSVSFTLEEFNQVSTFVSSSTHEHVDEFLEYCTYHLDPVEESSLEDIQHSDTDIEQRPDCYQLGEQAYEHLIEEGYIQPEEVKKLSLRAVDHPQVSYLTFVLPWGNDEAELWYWQRLEELRILPWLREQGVKKGDILMIDSDYEGYAERRIKRE